MTSIDWKDRSLLDHQEAHHPHHHRAIHLRVAASRDYEAISAIWDSASTLAHPFLTPEERSLEQALIRDRFLPSAITWVAELHGEIVGFLSRVAQEVAGLFVHPAFQRRGIGGLLLERAIGPHEEAIVHVYAANAVALDFYRTMGFRPLGWKDADALGRPYPVVLMARTALPPRLDDAAPRVVVESVSLDTLPSFVGLFDDYRRFYGQSSALEAAQAYLACRIAADQSIVLGACIDGRAVGFAQLYPTWSSIRMAPTLVLNDLYVDPLARGQQVGTALVQACEAEGRRRGIPSMTLETQRTNTMAIGLYKRLGWRQDDEFLTFTRSLT